MARTVLVTGTSTGIGEATARRLASGGWTVYAGVRKQADADRLAASISGVRPLILDVVEPDHIAAAVERIRDEQGGRLDGLVNNAGIGVGGPVELLPDEDWRRVFEVNFFGPVALTRAFIPAVRAAKGRMVLVGSVAGRVTAPTLIPYASTKHALRSLAEGLRHELRDQGVKVTLVEPGEVITAIWDKTDAEIDKMESLLDDESRPRYGRYVDVGRGFSIEGRTKGVPADKVAAVIERALTARRPRSRQLVGRDARAMGTVDRFLPDRAKDGFIRAGSKRWEKLGREHR